MNAKIEPLDNFDNSEVILKIYRGIYRGGERNYLIRKESKKLDLTEGKGYKISSTFELSLEKEMYNAHLTINGPEIPEESGRIFYFSSSPQKLGVAS